MVLHQQVASYLHAHEALAVGNTEHKMETLYPASITHVTIRPQLLSDYAQDADLSPDDWQAYLVSHGASLVRLLARWPGLTFVVGYFKQYEVVHQAILLQPCPQLGDVETNFGDFPEGLDKRDFPKSKCSGGHSLLHSAIAKGHLPL